MHHLQSLHEVATLVASVNDICGDDNRPPVVLDLRQPV